MNLLHIFRAPLPEPTPMQTLEAFFSQQKKRNWKAGEHVFFSHNAVKEAIYITKGFVRMYTNSEEGEEAVLSLYQPGAILALMELIPNHPNRFDFQALSAVEAYSCPKDTFLAFLQDNPAVLYDLLTQMSDGTYRLLYRIESTTHASVSQRLATFLYHIAQFYGEKNGTEKEVHVMLTHNDIASWLGIKRETVTRHMKQLHTDGIIESHKRRKIIIKNMDILQKAAPVSFSQKQHVFS